MNSYSTEITALHMRVPFLRQIAFAVSAGTLGFLSFNSPTTPFQMASASHNLSPEELAALPLDQIPHRLPNGRFYNPWNSDCGDFGFKGVFRMMRTLDRKRAAVTQEVKDTLVPIAPDWNRIRNPDPSSLQITWIGHASFLLQFNGLNILTDPITCRRCSPVQWAGPSRIQPPALKIDELPPIDAVIISHNHYDHLDAGTVEQIGNNVKWFVPLGIGSWLNSKRITNFVELDWGQSADFKTAKFVCTPCQHFSGRSLWDKDKTLWASWAIVTDDARFFFAGDTGYRSVPADFDETKRTELPFCPVFKKIGETYGPFDLACIPIGAYSPRWFMSRIHCDPGDAADMHLDIRSRQSVAMHWGSFVLTDEPILEPPRRLAEELQHRNIDAKSFAVLKHGETLCTQKQHHHT
eukprot:GILK01005603.1.p1 GENE.GILK01005603.1~~GILK01005603.1.p1  ORF type:complete len:417 (+),score=39.95 GILK01005603.1:30-1253(+)